MRKTTSRFWVDVASFLAFFGLVVTGLIMAFFTDSGPYADESAKYFLNLHRHQWGTIHLYFAIGFVVFILAHLVLEWRWITGKTRSLFKKAWMLVPVAGAAVLLVFVGWAITPKTDDFYNKNGGRMNRLVQGQRAGDSLMIYGKETDSPKVPCPEERKSGLHEGEARRQSSHVTITGRDSLLSIQEKTGLSAGRIVDFLKLPADISRTEQLGLLKRRFGFSIHDVREAVRLLSK